MRRPTPGRRPQHRAASGSAGAQSPSHPRGLILYPHVRLGWRRCELCDLYFILSRFRKKQKKIKNSNTPIQGDIFFFSITTQRLSIRSSVVITTIETRSYIEYFQHLTIIPYTVNARRLLTFVRQPPCNFQHEFENRIFS